MTGAARLAAAAIRLRTEPLPPVVTARAVDLLLDHLGVTIGGAREPSSAAVRASIAALGLGGPATVVGTTERFTPPDAALANGAAAHALEMDDTHQGGSIHLGASVFPAALAAAELTHASGDACLRAAIAGYEVTARLAMAAEPAAQYRRGFHPTGTCGVFGAAVAAGLLLDLDAAGITRALGIAGSQAAGSMEFLADGAWTKRLHPGWAAHAGLHAAALARAGFRGPATIVEGRFGFLHAYTDAPVPTALDGGTELELLRTSVKPHACCRYTQAPVDAALSLARAHAIDPLAVDRVEVGIVSAGFAIVCEPLAAKRRPASEVDAQFSLPFGIAAALVRGALSPAELAPAVYADACVRHVMDRVTPVRDADLDAQFPRVWPAWVRVHLRDGRVHEARVTHPSGDPENFPSPDALAAKLHALAGPTLGDAGCTRLVEAVRAVPAATSVRPLLGATIPGVI